MGLGIYYIGSVTKKTEWNVKSVNPLYLMINRIDIFTEEKNRDKYLNIASTDRNSEVLRNIFEKDGKYYPQSFIDECLYEV